MFKSLLFVSALLASQAIADQPVQQNKQRAKTKWYILAAQDAKCLLAADAARQSNSPSLASPAALEAFERQLGSFLGTDVIRDDADKITMVQVNAAYRDGRIRITFFPDREKCEADLKDKLETGALHDPKELE